MSAIVSFSSVAWCASLHAHTCTQTHTQFFSGDTCQTIALGVGFRFEDLKSLVVFEQQQQREKYRDVSVPSRLLIKIPKVQKLGNANVVCVGECALLTFWTCVLR